MYMYYTDFDRVFHSTYSVATPWSLLLNVLHVHRLLSGSMHSTVHAVHVHKSVTVVLL